MDTVNEAKKLSFAVLCHEELGRAKTRDGIGLYAEKRLHGVLKRYVCDYFSRHEQRVCDRTGKRSRYVADVLTATGEIFEIQTGSLYPMLHKIEWYLRETDYRVTVVHPLVVEKWLNWIDPETGEVTARKHSPKKENVLCGVAQLKAYAHLLGDPRFSLCLPLIAAEEFRMQDGWGREGKRGSHRYELIPRELAGEVTLSTREDYLSCLPADTPARFTAAQFAKLSHLRGYALYDALAVFEALGGIARAGKAGRAHIYERM